MKFRALRLDSGNFSWGSEAITRKARVLDVTYNASNNELVRTQTLVKGAIIQIAADPFAQFYAQHYGVKIGRVAKGQENVEDAKKSQHVTRKLAARADGKKLDTKLDDQFNSGRLYACISSRPGQCGRISGYILEGKELEFYIKKMTKRKKGQAAA